MVNLNFYSSQIGQSKRLGLIAYHGPSSDGDSVVVAVKNNLNALDQCKKRKAKDDQNKNAG